MCVPRAASSASRWRVGTRTRREEVRIREMVGLTLALGHGEAHQMLPRDAAPDRIVLGDILGVRPIVAVLVRPPRVEEDHDLLRGHPLLGRTSLGIAPDSAKEPDRENQPENRSRRRRAHTRGLYNPPVSRPR